MRHKKARKLSSSQQKLLYVPGKFLMRILVYQNEFAARYQDAMLAYDRCVRVRYEGNFLCSALRVETYYGSNTARVRNIESIRLRSESRRTLGRGFVCDYP